VFFGGKMSVVLISTSLPHGLQQINRFKKREAENKERARERAIE
jgi:hypothetical protein